jgi:predicted nucleic acid-binding protein
MLDSTAAVAAERQGKNARQLLESVALETSDDEIALSVITVLELAHGVALRAGQIDGQSQAKGIRIPLSDLLIGVSALELGYGVGTANIRHFQLIPGLNVIQL